MRCSGCGTENPDGPDSAWSAPRRCTGLLALRRRAAGRGKVLHGVRPAGRGRRPGAREVPRTYTPRHLAEKILATRRPRRGAEAVTILFADVVGSTELIRGRDPEEAQALLDGVSG